MPEENNENFWVREWIPQIEVLAHPAVQAGLTHCGFGGTSEFVSCGVPVVAFPHFFDQHDNAVEMEKRKVALILANRGLKLEQDFDKIASYKDPAFDE